MKLNESSNLKHLSINLYAVSSIYGSPMESCKANGCTQVIKKMLHIIIIPVFVFHVEYVHGLRRDKTLELFGTSSGSVFFSARRDMDEFSAAQLLKER